MKDVIVPDRMLNEAQRLTVAQNAVDTLLEIRSATEAYVILAQMEKIVELTKELLKERAIAGVRGKEMDVMGAKVSTRRTTAYEYDAPTLQRLDGQKKDIDARLKAIKKALEAVGTYADEATGEINTCKKIKEGLTIAVSLPKEAI